jgi:hypothetical protein
MQRTARGAGGGQEFIGTVDLAELERFLQDNADLERLEAIASDFNPFVAMGWVRQELRHSAFLRWMLDPSESHGLGAYPLRAFLRYLVRRGLSGPEAPTIFDVDGWDLTRTTAVTEWEQIDLFLQNDSDRFIVLLENKVDTKERSHQLARYADRVSKQFPDHKKCFVYLTPEGDEPSDDRYVAASYSDIADLLDLICERRGSQTSGEVLAFIRAYSEMIRRHIVENSEVQELCRRIYATHRKALDLIFEHRPDRQQELSEVVKDVVSSLGAILDQCSKTYVRWTTPILDRLPRAGEGWTRSGRMLLFVVESDGDQMVLKLILGPGPQDLRARVSAHVQRQDVFNRRRYKFYPQWWTFHNVKLLTKKQTASMELEDVKAHVRERLSKFFAEEIPVLESALLPVIEQLEAEAQAPGRPSSASPR